MLSLKRLSPGARGAGRMASDGQVRPEGAAETAEAATNDGLGSEVSEGVGNIVYNGGRM